MIDFDKDLEPLRELARQRRSRVAVIQALCQVKFFFIKDYEHAQNDIIKFYANVFTKKPVEHILNLDFLAFIFNYALNHQDDIEKHTQKYLRNGWKFSELSENLQLIFMAAVAELSGNTDTDAPVIINEYIEITKLFENEKQAKFVNGVLEKIRRDLRE